MCKVPGCNEPASGELVEVYGYYPHSSEFCKEHTVEYKTKMLEMNNWRIGGRLFKKSRVPAKADH